jgi:DNA-binding MarR family transcriptional regulator
MPRGQAMVLCTVAKNDGLTQSEIADQLSVQGATVTTMLQKMDEAGLVVRRRDANDNRLVRVYMTEIAWEKERAINVQFISMEDKLFAGIASEDRLRLRDLMYQLLRNME